MHDQTLAYEGSVLLEMHKTNFQLREGLVQILYPRCDREK